MKTLKIILTTILIVTITYAVGLIATFSTITLMGGEVTGVTSNAYQTTTGNLIISLPEPVNETQKGDLILIAGTTTSVGKTVGVTPIDDYNLVQVQTGDTESDVNNYTVSNTVQHVKTQIPVIGFLPGLLQKNIGSIIIFTLFLTVVAISFSKGYYQRKPKPQPVLENQIGILQDMFDHAPNRVPTRQEIKEYERTLKNAK